MIVRLNESVAIKRHAKLALCGEMLMDFLVSLCDQRRWHFVSFGMHLGYNVITQV